LWLVVLVRDETAELKQGQMTVECPASTPGKSLLGSLRLSGN
jgi:hypothetical protein